MTNETLDVKLLEISAVIETLPEPQREQLWELAEETRQRHECIERATARAFDALDDWRLLQKYRSFDTEARQREARARRRPAEDND